LNEDRFETQFRVELTENLECFGLKGFEGFNLREICIFRCWMNERDKKNKKENKKCHMCKRFLKNKN
jgi:hypothetical protein